MYVFNADTLILAYSNMRVDDNSFHMGLYIIIIFASIINYIVVCVHRKRVRAFIFSRCHKTRCVPVLQTSCLYCDKD